jgi:glycine betaine/proline transport system permease protein
MLSRIRQSKLQQFGLLIIVFLFLYHYVEQSENAFLNLFWRLPAMIAWLPQWLTDSISYVMFDWITIEVYNEALEENEEISLVKEITRSTSWFILFFIQTIREFLVGGIKTIVTFTSWDYIRDNPWAKLPGLPWTVVLGGGILLGYNLGGRKLAALVGISLAYISLFGQWEPAMKTVSLVLVAVPISVMIGLSIGVAAYRNRAIETALMPFLNIAQTMPQFSYLVPMTVLFGLGDHAAALAIVVYATPPMIRLTILGLRAVSPEVVEAGYMSGCSSFQLMFRVMLPTARKDILVGVNQVIMQCLAMVVIAALIGAQGLGDDLLKALNGLRIGKALELGICIVLIAIVMDRLSLAWANKQIDYFADLTFAQRHRNKFILFGILVGGIILAYIGKLVFKDGTNYLFLVPTNKGFTTEWFWQSGVDWMVTNWYTPLNDFKVWMIQSVLVPVKTTYLGMPVVATFVLIMGTGYLLGGLRSALIVGSFLLFIAFTEWWDRALITAYLTSISVAIAASLGFLIGVLSAQNKRAGDIVLVVCDTLQTFPSFIYLIPAIMLFNVSDTAVLIAITPYAMIPAMRYTVEGLRNVPPSLHDAGSMSGVNRFQRLVSIELPLAFPHIMLGINQTVMFALAMVIIGAMIGTDDLGQLILGSLSDRNGIGNGLILGLCVAFIGLIVDHLINRWAKDRRKLLGLG